MTIIELNKKGLEILKQNQIGDSNIKANMLLQYVLQKNKQELFINDNEEVDREKEKQYFQYIQEIIQGKPLQYITHKQEFMGLDFYVNQNVLIPQSDTEILVEEAIKVIQNKLKENEERKEDNYEVIRILDLCTGSGAIAIAIAKYISENSTYKNKIKFEIYASDISEKALDIAKKNIETHQVQVTFIQSDMFEKIKQFVTKPLDIIVSNPPYIEDAVIKTLAAEVQNEPYIALSGGTDGLAFYRIIAKNANSFLKKDGYVLLEIGYNQKESVTKLFQEAKQYDTIECIKDLSGNDRVIKVRT